MASGALRYLTPCFFWPFSFFIARKQQRGRTPTSDLESRSTRASVGRPNAGWRGGCLRQMELKWPFPQPTNSLSFVYNWLLTHAPVRNKINWPIHAQGTEALGPHSLAVFVHVPRAIVCTPWLPLPASTEVNKDCAKMVKQLRSPYAHRICQLISKKMFVFSHHFIFIRGMFVDLCWM